MKLQRTTMMASYPHVGTKDFYAASDVDALLARIREAVEAERATLPDCLMISKLAYHFGDKWAASRLEPVAKVRAALDALLSGAEVDR